MLKIEVFYLKEVIILWYNTISKVKSGILVEGHQNSVSYNKITSKSLGLKVSGNQNDIISNKIKSKINGIISLVIKI